MTDLTAPSNHNAGDAAALNGTGTGTSTFPADDAAGQTVAAMAESEKISAGNVILRTAYEAH
jgi:ubiquitin-like 1-activating enzyme E1 A